MRVLCLLASEGQVIQHGRVQVGMTRTRFKILSRCSRLGRLTGKRCGIRRSIAASISLGRFVAPRTIILSVPDSRPSHSLQCDINGRLSAQRTYIRHEFCFHHSGNFVITLGPLPQKRVNLVDEYDTRLRFTGKAE